MYPLQVETADPNTACDSAHTSTPHCRHFEWACAALPETADPSTHRHVWMQTTLRKSQCDSRHSSQKVTLGQSCRHWLWINRLKIAWLLGIGCNGIGLTGDLGLWLLELTTRQKNRHNHSTAFFLKSWSRYLPSTNQYRSHQDIKEEHQGEKNKSKYKREASHDNIVSIIRKSPTWHAQKQSHPIENEKGIGR